MLRLIGLVVSIGIADSLNPTTIAPALVLASGERALHNLAHFTAGVFVIYFLGGAAVALGPGELLLDAIPNPHHTFRHILEVVAGVIMLGVAGLVWRNRHRLAARRLDRPAVEGKSSFLLGLTITTVELPTAFPYFAAIAAIIGAGPNPGSVLLLLLLFNVCFILPLLLMILTLYLAGDHATETLARWRNFLQRRWPVLVAGLALLAGLLSLFVGISGLLVGGHSRISSLARKLRKLLHLSPKP